MSFREKSAWITLISVLICFGAYFAEVFSRFAGEHRFGGGLRSLHLLLLSVVALVALQVGLTLIAAWTTPKAGRGPADERETQIQQRAHTLGYHVLTALALALFAPAHFGHSGELRPVGGGDRRPDGGGGPDRHVPARGLSRLPSPISNQIRRLRFEHGEMTQSELAERIGMTRQTIAAIEAGKYSPSLEAAFRIAQVFEANLDDVFQWTGVRP